MIKDDAKIVVSQSLRGVGKILSVYVQGSTGGEKSHKKAKNMNQKLPQSHEAELRSDL